MSSGAGELPVEVLRRGELARGQVTKKPEQTARGDLSKLVEAGLFTSDIRKGPVRLTFAIESADVLCPRLFGPIS